MAYQPILGYLNPDELERLEHLDHNIAMLALERSDLTKARKKLLKKAYSRRHYEQTYGYKSNKPDGESVKI